MFWMLILTSESQENMNMKTCKTWNCKQYSRGNSPFQPNGPSWPSDCIVTDHASSLQLQLPPTWQVDIFCNAGNPENNSESLCWMDARMLFTELHKYMLTLSHYHTHHPKSRIVHKSPGSAFIPVLKTWVHRSPLHEKQEAQLLLW